MILHIFTDLNNDSDLAILKLSSSLTFNAYIEPACLPPNEDFYPENIEESVNGIVSGWGSVQDSNYNFSSLLDYKIKHFNPATIIL